MAAGEGGGMTEHRPGPWKIGAHADELTVIPITVSSEERWPWRIAAVYKNDPDLLPEYDGEAYANARLIAAAPDLLAACKGMVAAYRRDSFATLDDRREEFIACMDAIAKARGQT